jgi:hypothetical protein
MIRKRLTAEQVIHMLRDMDVELARFRENFSLHFRSILHYKGQLTDPRAPQKTLFR